MHRGPRGKSGIPFIAGSVSVITGVALLPVAADKLFAYSPYGNPAAGQAGLRLGIASVVLTGVPLLLLIVRHAWRSYCRYRAWKATLTPQEQFALTMAETALLIGGHLIWHDHNKRVSAALTASVMGDERDADAGR